MELWVGAINLGFLYGFMAMGVFITFRIHDFPDITVDGSFTTGGAVAAVLLVAGVNPLLALFAAFLSSALAGALTGLIHTRFNINGLLSGILVMTGLYSINLHLMGRSNIPLLNQPGVVSYLKTINPGFPEEVWFCLVFFMAIALFWILFSLFLRTDLGITMRATGNNAVMAGASGVNVNLIKIMGISLANGLVGISGAMVAHIRGLPILAWGLGRFYSEWPPSSSGVCLKEDRFHPGLSVIIGSVLGLMVALALRRLNCRPKLSGYFRARDPDRPEGFRSKFGRRQINVLDSS
jgi:putative ABC transport system permease protein